MQAALRLPHTKLCALIHPLGVYSEVCNWVFLELDTNIIIMHTRWEITTWQSWLFVLHHFLTFLVTVLGGKYYHTDNSKENESCICHIEIHTDMYLQIWFFNPLYLISRFMNTITMQICFFSSPGFGLLTQFSITTYESSFKRLASVLSNVCARCYQRSHSNEMFSLLSAMEPSLFSQLYFPFSWKSSMFCMHNTWTWSQVVPTKH